MNLINQDNFTYWIMLAAGCLLLLLVLIITLVHHVGKGNRERRELLMELNSSVEQIRKDMQAIGTAEEPEDGGNEETPEEPAQDPPKVVVAIDNRVIGSTVKKFDGETSAEPEESPEPGCQPEPKEETPMQPNQEKAQTEPVQEPEPEAEAEPEEMPAPEPEQESAAEDEASGLSENFSLPNEGEEEPQPSIEELLARAKSLEENPPSWMRPKQEFVKIETAPPKRYSDRASGVARDGSNYTEDELRKLIH